jgi:serine/threonine protein kinase
MISEIGEGGMSVVYLAEQISLKREIAVKVMRIEIAKNDLDVQRFKHEAKTIAQLDHPNIINIYNIGQTSKGEIFFTMPYLNHGDFSDYILEDESEFIKLLMSICDGLSFAHQRGVIHRDIKPENLLFDKFGNVQIADFGIAVSKDGTRMTQEHQIVGSAQYMSPEQARSLKVGPQTDVYSLGIVIYERLTGTVPFDGDESISILVDHVSTEPPQLSPKMRHWQKIIDKCLAKLPEDRYQSMSELKLALDSIPTNALQRTNDSIQQVLTSDARKHLKWFIPIFLLLLVIGVFSLNKTPEEIISPATEPQETNIVVAPVEDEDTDTDINKISTKEQEETPPSSANSTAPQIILKDEFASEGEEQLNNTLENTELITQTSATEEITATELDQQQDMTEVDSNVENSLSANNESLLLAAFENIEKYQLSRPKNNNATDQLLQVLRSEPENEKAIQGIENVGGKYYQLIKNSLLKYKFNTALKHARSLSIFNTKTNNLNRKYKIQNKDLISIIKKLDISSDSFSVEKVKSLARIVKTIDPKNSLIATLNDQAQFKLKPKVGETLLDEKNIETILITNNIAASTTEVSLEQYKEFSKQTNRVAAKCKQKGGGGSFFGKKTWEKHFFAQNSNHPVVCITQADANAYTKWLSKETGNRYRLPTKNEWTLMYAEANKNFKACESGNLAGKEANKIRNKESNYTCNDNYKFTAPVANFSKQKNGLFDIQGNVSEWISCPPGNCNTPIAMGNSWYHGQQSNKAIHEEKHKIDSAYSHIGFRVVRDL